MRLKRGDGFRIVRGLHHDDALGRCLVAGADLVLVAEDRVQVIALDRQSGIIAGADAMRSVSEIFGSPFSSCWRDFFEK